ncbi:hypothetical protein BH11CYA1_BH11CYA1_27960 [soil metagenome]
MSLEDKPLEDKSIEDKSLGSLLSAREALERGDFKAAKKMASMAISFNPSIEGYYYKAESNFLAGDLAAALVDLEAARDLCKTDEEKETWREPLEQCFLRVSGAESDDDGPPVCEIISVMLPTPIQDKDKALTKIINNPDLSTNGETLQRTGHSVVYDIEFLEFSPDWVDAIIEMSTTALESTVVKTIRKTAHFLHITGPNVEIEQEISSQVELAIQFVQTLEPLVRTIEAPVAVLRGSNNVVDYDTIRRVCDDINPENLIAFYIKVMNSGESLFSVGMHQFGFEDVEIPFSVVPFEEAIELITEFMHFQLVNNFSEAPEDVEYESNSAVYSLKRLAEVRFDVDGEARHNSIGIWHFLGTVSE